MTKTYFEVYRLCKEFGLDNEKLAQQLLRFIKFKSYQPSKTLLLSDLCGKKRAFMVSGVVYVYEPETPDSKAKQLTWVFGKNTSFCEVLPLISEKAIFHVKKNTRIFFLKAAEHQLIEAIPGMNKLNSEINRNMSKFNANWAKISKRPTYTNLDALLGQFPDHKFNKTDLAKLYGMSRTAFYNVPGLNLKELYEKHYPSKKKAA